jgi:predicted dehydrogenase
MRRRDVLFSAAAALSIGSRRILGANDRVQVGIVGLGGRGTDHLNTYLKLGDADVAAVCDVDDNALERAQTRIARSGRKPVRQFTDMRKLFEMKEVDAVSLPLPNHWHALASIWAMQAGKDVYCEKPASHDPFEGQKMVAAARKLNRMLQIGSQGRTMPHKIEAIKLLHDGGIGQVYMARGLCFKRRKSIGHKPDGPVPPGVNWDLFLGSAPMRPFNELRFKYNWHWFWDTGNGDIGNQGVHEVDIARWGLGIPDSHDTLRGVSSFGGKYVYNDDQETPNTQTARFDYGDKELVFEVRGLPTGPEGGLQVRGGNTVADLFYGSDGYLEMDGNGYAVYDSAHKVVKQRAAEKGEETGAHMENFLAAVKTRNYKDLTADIQIGAVSADLCHFANISYRVGRSLKWDNAARSWAGDSEANALMHPMHRSPYVIPEV